MSRRFPARVPKRYAWQGANAVGQFTDATVLGVDLVVGSAYQAAQSFVISEDRIANIIRVVGDVYISIDPTELNDVADNFIFGPAYWALIIVDEDDDTIYSPDTASVFDEKLLAYGMTPPIGLLLDTSAMVGGTGLGVSQGHQVPAGLSFHIDAHSNRRLSNDQVLRFLITRPDDVELTLQGSALYSLGLALRTLLKLP